MGQNILISLINNAALLLALSVVYEAAFYLPDRFQRVQPIFNGLLIALICVAIMSTPFTLRPYMVFDTRTVLIGVTALMFGLIPTIITAVAATVLRLSLGGIGILPGLATITSSALIGLAWRRWLYPKSKKCIWLNIYIMGIVIHLVMILCMLLLPYPDSLAVIRKISLPVMIIFPILTVLLSLLMIRQQQLKFRQFQIKQSEEKFKLLFDKAPLGYQSLDINGHFIEVNQQWLNLFGYSRNEVIGKWFGNFISPDYSEEFDYKFPTFKEQGQIHNEFEMLHKNGNTLFISFECKIGYDLNGKFKQTHCILKDITKQKEAENALRISEEKYRNIAENISDVVWTTDINFKTIFVNPSVESVLGETVEAHLNQSITQNLTPKSLIKAQAVLAEELEKESDPNCDKSRTNNFLLEYYHANGSTVWLDSHTSFIRNKNGNVIGIQGVSRDVTELKKTQDKLLYLSEHDDLTGLYNRRYFEKEIRLLDKEEQLPLSIIVIDINGLKLINNSFGVEEGDKIIVETAKLLENIFQNDTVVARTGGGEFGILLPKTDLDRSREYLDVIREAYELYNADVTSGACSISLSVGAATKDAANVNFEQISKEAEDYMHQRKLLAESSSRHAIISSIRATMLEKSFETKEHEDRLSSLAREVGTILKLSQIEIDSLELLGRLHDIGKIGIPEHILKKPCKLNKEEWVEMKKHPEIGYRIAMSSADTAPIAKYILSHHERWDGTGYPQNLKGRDIPLLARILSVVDAYDAMTEDRVYCKAITPKEAIEEIKRCAGTQFDPEIAKVFVEMMEKKNKQEDIQ